jgi:hypothetical protein
MQGYGVGASLASLGTSVLQQGTQVMGEAASQEAERNRQNTVIQAQQKAGRVQLGSTLGAVGGFALGAQMASVGGPLGSLIGGAIGAIASGVF